MDDRFIKTVLLGLTEPVKDKVSGINIPAIFEGADTDCVTIAKSLVTTDDNHDNEALYSIFNILNGNKDSKVYKPMRLSDVDSINYPVESCAADAVFLQTITNDINKELLSIQLANGWINDYLELLENDLTYMPSANGAKDISLFDEAKMCAALASCLFVAKQAGITYAPETDLFLLYSMDFSGIQDFIYTITSKGALKSLRARSFYLEILMENIVDDLLAEVGLTRVNLIYSGGGHSYILLPNTQEIIDKLESFNKSINDWLLDMFDISLYVGYGYVPCSGNSLRNIPEGSYFDLFRTVSSEISAKKSNRYTAEQIIRINSRTKDDYSRECKVCKRIDVLNAENECKVCGAIKSISAHILTDNFFAVVNDSTDGIPLPFKRKLVAVDNDAVSANTVRIYRKNKYSIHSPDSVGLWVGDYYDKECGTFADMAKKAKDKKRIERIGVVRADVDNLGSTFSSGFAGIDSNLMRTAALSRQLSLFFKHHINSILREKNRSATICYSGGDDLFIVGEWIDVLELSTDISRKFKEYSQGTLSISAGVGIYGSSYPISRIAYETAEMEDLSKQLPDKDAITLFQDNTYKWADYEEKVIGEKLKVIKDFFDYSDSRGRSFLYRILELLRNQNERINFARLVYLLARLEPGDKAPPEEKARYKEFSQKIVEWVGSEEDIRQLCTAIMLYVYMTRNKNEEDDSDGNT